MKIKIMSKITQAFIESLANSSLDSGKVDSDETKKEDNCIDRKIDARQASHSHESRSKLARAVLMRGKAVNKDLTKTYK